MKTSSFTFTSRGASDLYLMKLDRSGKELWTRSYGSASNDDLGGMILDKKGNCLITGSYLGDSLEFSNAVLVRGSSKGNFFLANVDPEGSTSWLTKGVQEDTIYYESGNSLGLDKNSNIYVLADGRACSRCETYFISKFDLKGNIISSSVFRENGYSYYWAPSYFNLLVDDSANLYIRNDGYRYSGGNLAKYDSLFQRKWAISYPWTCGRYVSTVLDQNGNLYISGYTGPSGYCSLSNGQFDGFVKKIGPDGKTIWTKAIEGPGNESAGVMNIDRSGNCYLTGSFNFRPKGSESPLNQKVIFDNDALISFSNEAQIFMAKIGTEPLPGYPPDPKTENQQTLLTFNIYPNPADKNITVDMPEKDAKLKMYNMYGQVSYQSDLKKGINYFDLSTLPKTVYVIQVTTTEQQITKTLVLH